MNVMNVIWAGKAAAQREIRKYPDLTAYHGTLERA
jgi:hypothetical protein